MSLHGMLARPQSAPAVPATAAGADWRGDPPGNVMSLVLAKIAFSVTNAPRSLQKRIGPSEIGMPCDHCLAARLAGWTKTETGVPWLPFIGTCVHERLERLFAEENTSQATTVLRTFQEARVKVGQIRGVDITGSTDLYIPADQTDGGMDGMTVDWKIVGTPTLRTVRARGYPSDQYVAQAMLYAKGWNDAGHPTSHVCVQFFPRDSRRMEDGYTWCAPYDPDIAAAALERANRTAATLDILEQVGGTEARDAWIRGLPRAERCPSCKKYPDWVEAQGVALLK